MRSSHKHAGSCGLMDDNKLRLLLCQRALFYRSQGVVDFDEVLLTVILQDQSVEVKPDSVARVGPQPPLQVAVWRIRSVWKPWRLDHSCFTGVDAEGFPNWKHNRTYQTKPDTWFIEVNDSIEAQHRTTKSILIVELLIWYTVLSKYFLIMV